MSILFIKNTTLSPLKTCKKIKKGVLCNYSNRRFSANTSQKNRVYNLSFILPKGFFMQKNSTLVLVRAGVISALYVALSFITMPISGGVVQFRPSEGLTLLPLLYLESIPALFIGCILFNLISGLPIYDVILGSVITLVACVFTYIISKLIKKTPLKIFLGGLFPVLLNALFLPLIWYWFSGQMQTVYILSVLSLFISQSLSVYVIGTIVYTVLSRLKSRGVEYL